MPSKIPLGNQIAEGVAGSLACLVICGGMWLGPAYLIGNMRELSPLRTEGRVAVATEVRPAGGIYKRYPYPKKGIVTVREYTYEVDGVKYPGSTTEDWPAHPVVTYLPSNPAEHRFGDLRTTAISSEVAGFFLCYAFLVFVTYFPVTFAVMLFAGWAGKDAGAEKTALADASMRPGLRLTPPLVLLAWVPLFFHEQPLAFVFYLIPALAVAVLIAGRIGARRMLPCCLNPRD